MGVRMIVAATLTVGVDCPKCKYAVPVNGIATGTRCDNCGAHVPLDWKRLLDLSNINALERALDLKPGRQDRSPFDGIHLVVERLEPTCTKCKATLPPDDLVARAAQGPGKCVACGAIFPLRQAPSVLREAYSAARAVVHEGIVADASDVDQKREPIVFPCMSCGGGLDLDGADRTVTCRFCNKVNYLPDGVWLRLHPPRQLEPFVVLSEIDEVGVFVSEYRNGNYEKAERDAKRTDLSLPRLLALAQGAGSVELVVAKNPSCTPEVLLVLAKSSEWRVRDAATKHPKATDATVAGMIETSERLALTEIDEDDDDLRDSEEWALIGADKRSSKQTLVTLAREGGERVRAAVVANRSTPLEIAREFVEDEHEDVRAGLAKRRDLPAELVDKLARDDDATVRAVIARRKDLSAETSAALAADDDTEVLFALAKNEHAPAEVLTKLGKSSSERVSEGAKANPSYKRKWWDVF